jgi:hypothetical protein
MPSRYLYNIRRDGMRIRAILARNHVRKDILRIKAIISRCNKGRME